MVGIYFPEEPREDGDDRHGRQLLHGELADGGAARHRPEEEVNHGIKQMREDGKDCEGPRSAPLRRGLVPKEAYKAEDAAAYRRGEARQVGPAQVP